MDTRTIVILGKPGSGKGVQAHLLAKDTGYPLFNASDHLRAFAAKHPHIGERVLSIMNEGGLVPVWLVNYLWTGVIFGLRPEDGIIFEGSMRREGEAEVFDDMMRWLGREYVAVYLAVSDDELRSRLKKRAFVEGRADDAEDVITHRLAEYRANSEEVLRFFTSRGRLLEVNGEGAVDTIHNDILSKIGYSDILHAH